MVDFLYGAPKTCQFFKVLVVLPPSGKISAGAHDMVNCGSSYVSIFKLLAFSEAAMETKHLPHVLLSQPSLAITSVCSFWALASFVCLIEDRCIKAF